MTNEGTIKSLKKLKSFHNGSYGTALDTAIKALEQVNKIKEIVKATESEYEERDKVGDMDYESYEELMSGAFYEIEYVLEADEGE